MTSQPGKQTTAIHILSNISRSKYNQTMKFGQLIEHNMRNIFLEKSLKNVLEKLILDPFLKSQKLSISLDQKSKVSFSGCLFFVRYWTVCVL